MKSLKSLSTLSVLSFLAFGCAGGGIKNASTFDHNDKNARASLVGKTPSQVEAILGSAVRKGHPVGGSGIEKRTFKLVYVEAGQAPVYDWQMKMKIHNNTKDNSDTGVKCVAVNFDMDNGYKFVEGGAAVDWNYDCISYKDLTGQNPS